MKQLAVIGAAILLLGGGCDQHRPAEPTGRTGMQADSTYVKEPSATVVHRKDAIRLGETMGELKDYPNITQADLDAQTGKPSAEVVTVKRGEKLRLGEPRKGR